MKTTKEVYPHSSSTLVVDYVCCETCDVIRYKEFIGIEKKDSVRRQLREPGKGFFFDKKLLGASDFFKPKHTGLTLCTQKAKDFILEKEFTNIEFMEVGDLLN